MDPCSNCGCRRRRCCGGRRGRNHPDRCRNLDMWTNVHVDRLQRKHLALRGLWFNMWRRHHAAAVQPDLDARIRSCPRNHTGHRSVNDHPGEEIPVAVAPRTSFCNAPRFLDLRFPRIALGWRFKSWRPCDVDRGPYSNRSRNGLEYRPPAAILSFASKTSLAPHRRRKNGLAIATPAEG